MEWKLKLDEEGKAVLSDDGIPIWINPDEEELALDSPGMYAKIGELNSENKQRREATDEANAKLTLFEGIEDLGEWFKAATKAVQAVKDFEDKDWMDVKKVEKLKSEMSDAFESQVNTLKANFSEKEEEFTSTLTGKDAQIRMLMVTSKFASSQWFTGESPKTNLVPDIAEAYFGRHFKVEEKNGILRLVATHVNGDEIYSKLKPGEAPDFDEAIGQIIDMYPDKDRVLKGSPGGSGAGGGSGGSGGSETSDLAELEAQYAAAKESKDSRLMLSLRNKIHAERAKEAD